jgi:hypothetical protein
MKIVTVITIPIFLISTQILGQIQKSNNGFRIKISFNSVLDENRWEYRSDGQRIQVYEKRESVRIIKTNKQLAADSIKKIHLIVSEVFEKIPSDTAYSNPTILDGYLWDVEVEKNSIKKHFQVINQNFEYLDKIILFLNNNLEKKYRIIYPTSFYFKR